MKYIVALYSRKNDYNQAKGLIQVTFYQDRGVH